MGDAMGLLPLNLTHVPSSSTSSKGEQWHAVAMQDVHVCNSLASLATSWQQ
jgi:hypothetical protein